MDECVYFTRRKDQNGFVKVWVFKEMCPSCGKGLMGKPRDEKTGKPRIRAKEYVCPECNYTLEADKYEDSLTACVHYECSCGNKDDIEISFKRKSVGIVDEETGKRKSAKALVFECSKCGKRFVVTKKMKG